MAEKIFHRSEDGQLEPMYEEAFSLEDRLQELVAENPSLLSGEQMNPHNPPRFLLVDREHGISDIIGGSSRWSLDHLFIDQNAVPTLVETKLQGNPEIRREIVGQMMDYAAHAGKTWNSGDIRRTFEGRCNSVGKDAIEVLQDFLQDEEADIEEFWQDVDNNLRAKKLRLLFVADGIPDKLATIVEFLNEQMPAIEVLAVEIKQFRGDSGSTLVPRVVGRTSEALAASSRGRGRIRSRNLDEQSLVDSLEIENVQAAARKILDVAKRHRANFSWNPESVTIRYRCAGWKDPVRVASIHVPDAVGWHGGSGFVFGSGNGDQGFWERISPELRCVLEKWPPLFSEDEFAKELSVANHQGCSISHQAAAENIDLLCERLDRVLRQLSELQSTDG